MALKLGLIGTGTVGCGCIEILQKHKAHFKQHFGVDIELARVCSRSSAQAEKYGLGELFTPRWQDVVTDSSVDIVVELIGGTTDALEIILEALKNGKDVVTANKAVMATYGKKVLDAAHEAGREVLFEASVGGGISIIQPMKHSLISNEISSVMGIVNGTTNYMLTRMVENGLSYEAALKEAQERGFAEADPTADVDGFDSAAKIAILASIAFNSRVTINDVHTEGIRNVTPLDLESAADMGYVIKLLALAHRTPNGIDVRVHPTMLPKTHQLATVNGVYNAIYVVGDFVGETMFFGEGAGSGPAASAVMGDVVELARSRENGVSAYVGCTCTDDIPILPMDKLQTKYYIRFTVADKPGVLAAMAGVFAKYGVSVKSVVQRGGSKNESVNLSYVTHTACEASVKSVLEEISKLDGVLKATPSIIRVEG